jgi:uncharacterized protein YecT (DUF1311 family)
MRLFLTCLLVSAATLAGAGASNGQTQADMNEEAARAFAKTEQHLKDVETRLAVRLSPEAQAALRQAQQAWHSFRDRECDFETVGSAGASLHPFVILLCKSRLTDERIKALDGQILCREGDVACAAR